MATRDAHDATSGELLTAANLDKRAGGWIGTDQPGTSKTTSGTTELDICSLSVPINANRKIRVTFHVFSLTFSAAADPFSIRMYLSGTAFQTLRVKRTTDTLTGQGECFVGYADNATDGNKTVKVTAQRGSGTGTLNFPAGDSTESYYMLVEDIGSTS